MKRLLQIFLPFVIIAGAVMLANFLINSKPKAAASPSPERVALVEVAELAPGSHSVVVDASGIVTPARTLVVQPEVSGRVLEHHPALVAGGRIPAGDELVRIDDRDYELAVAAQLANLARAKTELKVEKGRRRVAAREWDLVKPTGGTAEGRDLALRGPQQAAVKANIAAVRSGLDRARLAATKTTIKAPFNALVTDEAVEIDQIVGPASRLATLIGTDRYWVEVSIPVDQLRSIQIPGISTANEKGSAVKVVQHVGAERVQRTGWVARLRGELDPLGKMARVVVAVDNPLGLAADGKTTQDTPLLLGAYVTVEIAGGELTQVAKISREALRDGGKVWLMDAEDRMEIRPVEVRWKTENSALISGVKAGERLVTGRVATPIVGLKLALEGDLPKTIPTDAPPAVKATPADGAKSAKAPEGGK